MSALEELYNNYFPTQPHEADDVMLVRLNDKIQFLIYQNEILKADKDLIAAQLFDPPREGAYIYQAVADIIYQKKELEKKLAVMECYLTSLQGKQ